MAKNKQGIPNVPSIVIGTACFTDAVYATGLDSENSIFAKTRTLALKGEKTPLADGQRFEVGNMTLICRDTETLDAEEQDAATAPSA